MSKGLRVSEVVAAYRDIKQLETEAARRREDVVTLVKEGRVSHEDMADLISVTPSAVYNMVKTSPKRRAVIKYNF